MKVKITHYYKDYDEQPIQKQFWTYNDITKIETEQDENNTYWLFLTTKKGKTINMLMGNEKTSYDLFEITE